VIDENAIARITDPPTRKAPLAHLAAMAGRANIEIQVIPVTAGIYPGAGEVFTILSFPDPAERDFVYLETTVDDRMLEETDELSAYTHRFTQLAATALTPRQTRTTLTKQTG